MNWGFSLSFLLIISLMISSYSHSTDAVEVIHNDTESFKEVKIVFDREKIPYPQISNSCGIFVLSVAYRILVPDKELPYSEAVELAKENGWSSEGDLCDINFLKGVGEKYDLKIEVKEVSAEGLKSSLDKGHFIAMPYDCGCTHLPVNVKGSMPHYALIYGYKTDFKTGKTYYYAIESNLLRELRFPEEDLISSNGQITSTDAYLRMGIKVPRALECNVMKDGNVLMNLANQMAIISAHSN